MRDQMVALLRRWFEGVWNDRRDDVIDEILTADSVCYSDHGPLLGPQDFREKMFQPFVAAFPDLRVTVEDILVDQDQAVVRWTATGTHTGEAMGLPASGKPLQFRGMTWVRTDGTHFQEGWQTSDIPQVLQQLAAPT